MAEIITITDFQAPELDIYARCSETQLLHYYEPKGGIFIAESPKVIERALHMGCEPISILTETKHIDTQLSQSVFIKAFFHRQPIQTIAQMHGLCIPVIHMLQHILPKQKQRPVKTLCILKITDKTNLSAFRSQKKQGRIQHQILTRQQISRHSLHRL